MYTLTQSFRDEGFIQQVLKTGGFILVGVFEREGIIDILPTVFGIIIIFCTVVADIY